MGKLHGKIGNDSLKSSAPQILQSPRCQHDVADTLIESHNLKNIDVKIKFGSSLKKK